MFSTKSFNILNISPKLLCAMCTCTCPCLGTVSWLWYKSGFTTSHGYNLVSVPSPFVDRSIAHIYFIFLIFYLLFWFRFFHALSACGWFRSLIFFLLAHLSDKILLFKQLPKTGLVWIPNSESMVNDYWTAPAWSLMTSRGLDKRRRAWYLLSPPPPAQNFKIFQRLTENVLFTTR